MTDERNRLNNGRFLHDLDNWTLSGATYSAGDGDDHYGVAVLSTGGDYIEQTFSVPRLRSYSLHLSTKPVGAALTANQVTMAITDGDGNTVVTKSVNGPIADKWGESEWKIGLAPGTTYSDKNYWVKKDTKPLRYDEEVSVNGHMPFGATSHPHETTPGFLFDDARQRVPRDPQSNDLLAQTGKEPICSMILGQGSQLFKNRFQGGVGLLEEIAKGGVTLATSAVRPLGFLHLNKFIGHAETRKDAYTDAASDSRAQRGRLRQQRGPQYGQSVDVGQNLPPECAASSATYEPHSLDRRSLLQKGIQDHFKLKATPSRTARAISARPCDIVSPTNTPRARGFQCGLRSPMR